MNTDKNSVAVFPLAILQDNYVWCIRCQHSLVVIDPGEAAPVLAYCQQHQCSITHILITHFHDDHIAGIETLRAHFPQVVVINAPTHPLYLTQHVDQTDQSSLVMRARWADYDWQVFLTPGHRPEHVSYVLTIEQQQWLFCGDVLFSLGCGRLSDGITPESIRIAQRSLAILRELSDTTWLCCTHEYTLANLAFVLQLLPNSDARYDELLAYQQKISTLRAEGRPSLPTRLGFEKRYNPFLQWDDVTMIEIAQREEVRLAVDRNANQKDSAPLTSAEVFGALRHLKNQF